MPNEIEIPKNLLPYRTQLRAALQFFKDRRDKLQSRNEWPEEIKNRTKDKQTVSAPTVSNYLKYTGTRETYLLILEGIEHYIKEKYSNWHYNKGKKEYIVGSIKRVKPRIADNGSNGVAKVNDISGKEIKALSLFSGIYVGYFIRPRGIRNMKNPEERITKLTLLLCPNNEAFARSTHSESKKLKTQKLEHHYKGQWKIINSSLHINFCKNEGKSAHEALIALDIETKKNDFNKILKGVYADTAVMNRPNGGRIILHQSEPWDKLKGTRKDIVRNFLSNLKYKPSYLSHAQAIRFLKNVDNLEFFTTDTRYIENIRVIDKYAQNEKILTDLKGDYSVFFISDDEQFISHAICRITKFGEVFLNSSQDDQKQTSITYYNGKIQLLEYDNIFISFIEDEKKKDVVFYLLKIGPTPAVADFFNGVRMRPNSAERDHAPITTSVVFIRESDRTFYQRTKGFNKIPIYSTNDMGRKLLDMMKENYREAFELLLGSIY